MKRAPVIVVLLTVLSVLNLLPIGTTAHASARPVPVDRAVALPAIATYLNSAETQRAAIQSALKAKAQVHTTESIHWIRGYSLQDGWFCFGWPSYYHCTQAWRHENKWPYTGIISLNTAWVPNNLTIANTSGGSSPVTVDYTAAAPASSTSSSSGGWSYDFLPGEFCTSLDFGNENYISQWTVPPSCYGNIYYPNPNNYAPRWNGFGWCNWWPEALRPGYPTIWDDPNRGSVPRPGATVFYSGGVQGASSDGHFSVVVAVSPGGYWVLVTEMNFYWRGGGWQKVDYRYIHTGWGVTFLY